MLPKYIMPLTVVLICSYVMLNFDTMPPKYCCFLWGNVNGCVLFVVLTMFVTGQNSWKSWLIALGMDLTRYRV